MLVAVILASSFTGIVHADEPLPPKEWFTLEEAISAVKKEVVKEFKDPYSARFEQLRYNHEEGGPYSVCGTVNAKNSYGAYAGAVPFYGLLLAMEGANPVVFVGIEEFYVTYVESMCKKEPLTVYQKQ